MNSKCNGRHRKHFWVFNEGLGSILTNGINYFCVERESESIPLLLESIMVLTSIMLSAKLILH